MKATKPWPLVGTCVALAAISGVASFIITAFFGALTGAGHGSGVPVEVYLAPYGLGLIAPPILFLAIAVPRRWLPFSLAFVLLVLAVRFAGAYVAYRDRYDDLDRIDAFLPVVYGLCALTAVASLMSPIWIVLRILLGEPSVRPIGMQPENPATQKTSTPP